MSEFLPAECPEHKEGLRIGYDAGGRSGYCAKCEKHYPLCTTKLRGAICQQLQGHEGRHQDARGDTWD